jgi:hypothetical protein
VTGDRLLHTIKQMQVQGETLVRAYEDQLHKRVALWLAIAQDDAAEAALLITADVDAWLDLDDISSDPWAHDWRKFLSSRSSITGEPSKSCGICGDPARIWGQGLAACNDRHWNAMQGRLPDEQCRLCNEVKVCAHDLDGSPVCADCWPGKRLLRDRRAAWASRFKANP